MRIQIGKVFPVLALSIAMSEAGAVRGHVIEASASHPPFFVIADSQVEVGRRPNSGLSSGASLQYALPEASEVRLHLAATEIGPVPPVGVAKTLALVLSSLGMFSVISMLRLNRTL
jgi:hypothetical protein